MLRTALIAALLVFSGACASEREAAANERMAELCAEDGMFSEPRHSQTDMCENVQELSIETKEAIIASADEMERAMQQTDEALERADEAIDRARRAAERAKDAGN